ncbi:MAG: YbaB/EbfC family nucleoid-associated protein [Chloroflexota bacterium]
MSRRGDPRRAPQMPRMNPGSQQNLLQSFQQKMQEAQDALASETLEVSAGGGAVTVVITGQQKIQAIKISPDVLSAGDVEMLQDLVVVAVNEAIEKSQQLAAGRMGELTGGLGLPNILG